jgi:hypothetical protein
VRRIEQGRDASITESRPIAATKYPMERRLGFFATLSAVRALPDHATQPRPDVATPQGCRAAEP